MLTDIVIGHALDLLKNQFSAVMGLSQPITEEEVLTRWPLIGEEHKSYKPYTKNDPYVQIINTGHEHWVTCYKAKGNEHVLSVTF